MWSPSLLVSAILLAGVAAAAPSPQPASYEYKQTNRTEVVARRLRGPQRRNVSPVSYPPCAYTSSSYDAAVYPGYTTSVSLGTTSLGQPVVTTLQACIEACRDTSGRSWKIHRDG